MLSGDKRLHLDSYATPGFADHFMNDLKVDSTKFGEIVKETFKSAYLGI